MIERILYAGLLLGVTVVMHSVGLVLILRVLRRVAMQQLLNFVYCARTFVVIGWYLVLLHFCEIVLWALFYYWQGCLPDFEAALYFSGTTYSTIGYGDVVLTPDWRLFGPVEGLTGILMCGLSTGFFFAIVSRLVRFQSVSQSNPGVPLQIHDVAK